MFGVFAIDEILPYRGTCIPGSRTLFQPGQLSVSTFTFSLMQLQALLTFVLLALLHNRAAPRLLWDLLQVGEEPDRGQR